MTIAWAYCRFSSDHQREESIDWKREGTGQDDSDSLPYG